MKLIIYFDADDTLWFTNVIYDRAYERFARWVGSICEVPYDEVLHMVKERDLQETRVKGFHRTCFGAAMVATSEEICRSSGVPFTADHAMTAYRIADSVFDEVPGLHPAARSVLEEVSRDHEVNVITLGDRVVQSSKLYLTGLLSRFTAVEIVSSKDLAVYSRIHSTNPGVAHVMVGNSPKSDILPALAAGWYAVWLEGASTWAYDTVEFDPEHQNLFVVDDLSQVPAAIIQIQGLSRAADEVAKG